MEERDDYCGDGMVCARKGYDGRDYGGCVQNYTGPGDYSHCCSAIRNIYTHILYMYGTVYKIWKILVYIRLSKCMITSWKYPYNCTTSTIRRV